ncbi:glycosyltransferase family 2 protein [Microbacterium tenebrionis]|uniref:glycosyltransferase family 2 protein n=1 Tax=Microbacterium tenebrionis TaxID=2830665 RepID=UPI00158BD91A|nr:glycosyltransferase [Microbacterium ihumii]
MTPRVSIVMRTKDRSVFLERALRSVAQQTLSDWELIIVNDGGLPRAVRDVVRAVKVPDHARVHIIDNDSPAGRWPAANAGVRAATGEFLILHDDDDSWSPRFLERAVGYLETQPDRHGVVSRIEIVWERREGEAIVEERRERFLPGSVAPLLMDQQRFNHFVPIAFLYRRSLHDVIGLYDESIPVVGDWVFNTRVLELGPLEYLSDEPLVFWHQRPTSVGADSNSVIGARNEHDLHDALLRDAAFRSYVNLHGAGGMLYFEWRLKQLENALREEMASQSHEATNPITVALRRLWRRIRR